MKKTLKILKWAGIVLLMLIAALVVQMIIQQKRQAEDQAMMVKPDEELIGTRFYVPRDNGESVRVNLYPLNNGERHPLVINIHGGAFIAGDADTLDTQSDRISRDWDVVVATINYTLAKGGYDKGYGTQEVVDTVKYFYSHGEEYGIDPERIIVMGYSAGGYHAMASVLTLHEQGIDIYRQVLCYPFISETLERYNAMPDSLKSTVPPTLFIICKGDPISEGSLTYADALETNGIRVDIKTYESAQHGFIEENNPEYEKLHSHASMSPEQEILARDAEHFIDSWIKDRFE